MNCNDVHLSEMDGFLSPLREVNMSICRRETQLAMLLCANHRTYYCFKHRMPSISCSCPLTHRRQPRLRFLMAFPSIGNEAQRKRQGSAWICVLSDMLAEKGRLTLSAKRPPKKPGPATPTSTHLHVDTLRI